uniref:Uncharacterized protein n=1 Tax=Mycetohabitans sp. TaxID=2571162 RepID=A0A6B9HDG4_9BURK|nr:hypothetical protein [Mycetohabitans sp.]
MFAICRHPAAHRRNIDIMPLGDSLQARLTRKIILNYSQLLLLGVPAHNPPRG